MSKRKSLSKKLRFEVFKRDKFTCQYCGQKAPEIVLHLDHIIPVIDGGEDELMNLVTSCVACNLGKGARQLADDSVIVKQGAMLQDLSERRQQLQMLKEWRDELRMLDHERTLFLAVEIRSLAKIERELSSGESHAIESWLRRFTVEQLLEAAEISASQYLEYDNGQVIGFFKYFGYIPRIAHNKKVNAGKEELFKNVAYVQGILRNRFHAMPDDLREVKNLIAQSMENFGFEIAKAAAQDAESFEDWKSEEIEAEKIRLFRLNRNA